MKTILFGLVAVLFLFSACNSADANENTENQTDSTETAATDIPEATEEPVEPAPSESDAAPQDGQAITVKGLIKDAVIDPYPMGSLTFVTDKGETLNLYFEGTTVEMEQLPNRVGEQATITYRVKNDKAVMDVLLGDETLMGDIDHQEHWKMLKGTLIAKDENRGGDLPGYFEIQLEDGSTESFEAFLTDPMISQSGKEVYVFYDSRQTLVLENVQ